MVIMEGCDGAEAKEMGYDISGVCMESKGVTGCVHSNGD
jgi:hypothetical protein